MADNKRNSVASKIATPRTAGIQPPADTLEALNKAIGARVTITTIAPISQTFEGSLFTACPITNIVALNTRSQPSDGLTSSAPQPGDFRIIPISRIQNFQIVSLAAGGDLVEKSLVIGPVDIKRLKDREAARISKLKEVEANRGKGVTKEGQAIYDALKRVNIPIRWHNQEMIVHEAVIIAPPYRSEDCRGSKDKQQVLNQVKKVLDGERRKLKDREDRERKAATPPAGPRKGG